MDTEVCDRTPRSSGRLSDFMFFGSIVSRSDVTIAAKAFVFIFGCVGLYLQVINYRLRRQASSGVKLKSGPLFEINDSNENCFMALLSSTCLGCCFDNIVRQKSRDMNAGDELTEDERKYCLLNVSLSSGSGGPIFLEDLPNNHSSYHRKTAIWVWSVELLDVFF